MLSRIYKIYWSIDKNFFLYT